MRIQRIASCAALTALAAITACGGEGDGPASGAGSHADAGSPGVGRDASSGEASASADSGTGAHPGTDAGATDTGAGTTDGGAPVPEAGTPAPNAARQKVLAFLAGTSGKKTAIGVEDKDSYNPHADSDHMASIAGKGRQPSFWSADWGFGGAVAERENIVQEGERQWAQGALVQYIYHACSPAEDESCQYSGGPAGTNIQGSSLSDPQWKDLVTPGGTLYQAWLARLDLLAKLFQELKDAGVAPLFRPLHEINGSWAWWQGRPGAGGSLELYRITHDYLVKTKGLDNIVWVYNVQDYDTLAADVPVYLPGPSYFDVLALDVYNTGYTSGNYQAMLGGAAGKPIGVAECQYLPDPSTLSAQPKWAFVAMWPDFFSDDTSKIPALFDDPTVLTLSQMPGWK